MKIHFKTYNLVGKQLSMGFFKLTAAISDPKREWSGGT